MNSFNDRQKGEEARHAMKEELRFKATARRNKLFGLWAAEQLGLRDAAAADYAKDVVVSDFQAPGEEDVFVKVWTDLQAKGVKLSEHQVRREMQRLFDVAADQVTQEVTKG